MNNNLLKTLAYAGVGVTIALSSMTMSAENLNVNKSIQPVKNVILMISDGTSLPVLSLTRWYNRTIDPQNQHLNLDPYICGTILTYCSNAPIGDSAPTTSCYMTGYPSIEKFVATFPYSCGANNLVPIDSARAYSPMMTLMEATRILQGRRTGIVVTSNFTDATPADCASHTYKRREYGLIARQLANNHLNIMLGGGNRYLSPEDESFLKSQGYSVFRDDKQALDHYKGDKMWAIFGSHSVPYDIDRNKDSVPSLAEMTAVAIKNLNNSKGFFLMVEGSKVDWAAHANDPVGIATEFRAFDEAFKVACDFAKKDGHTVIVVTSDHGNSGISIGRQSLSHYSARSQQELFGQLCRIRMTADGLAELMQKTPFDQTPELFQKVTGIKLNDEELNELKSVKGYKQSPLSENERKEMKNVGLYSNSLTEWVAHIYRKYIPVGFTTHGHTGEEVFLAICVPKETPHLVGFNTNIELSHYLQKLLGIRTPLIQETDTYFVPQDKVFKDMTTTVTGEKPMEKTLRVTNGENTLEVKAFSNQLWYNNKVYTMKTPVVYVDKTNKFYLNKNLRQLLQGDKKALKEI